MCDRARKGGGDPTLSKEGGGRNEEHTAPDVMAVLVASGL